jgi:NhaP-type Na+/H+ or K+/H+ antiporter
MRTVTTTLQPVRDTGTPRTPDTTIKVRHRRPRHWVEIVLAAVAVLVVGVFAGFGIANASSAAPYTPAQAQIVALGGSAGAVPVALTGHVPSGTQFYTPRFGAF